jgi:Domain of unknown function (DUF397)
MNIPVPPQILWRKSSYSGGVENNCVEVAGLDGHIGVRDSKNPGAGHLAVTRRDFAALLARLAPRTE